VAISVPVESFEKERQKGLGYIWAIIKDVLIRNQACTFFSREQLVWVF